MALALALALCLCLFEGRTQHIQYEELEPRTRRYAQDAIQSFLSGLGGTAYPIFRESQGLSTITLFQIYPGNYSAKGTPQITFKPPNEVKVVCKPVGFCIELSVVAVYDFLVVPLSSYGGMTICGDCDITLRFSNKTKAVETALKVNWNIANFWLENSLMRLFSLDRLLPSRLKASAAWNQYIETIMQTAWNNTAAFLYAAAYNAYKINVNYEAGSIGLRLPMAVTAVSPSHLDILYAPSSGQLSAFDETAGAAHIHELNHKVFSELYAKAMGLRWNISIDATSIPSNLTVKMNTVTFGQVIPDLMYQQLDKNLSAVVVPSPSSVDVSISEEHNEVHIHNLLFVLTIYDWNKQILLTGNFNVELRVKVVLQCNLFSTRLVPVVTQATVEVTNLKSPSYNTVIKGGMARIIEKLINEHYIKLYGSRTLSEGIQFTYFSEAPDPTKSTVAISGKSLRVMIVYRTH